MPENKTVEFQLEEIEQKAEPIQARTRIRLDVQAPASSCSCGGGCESPPGD
jgi:hypothetical protein